MATVSASPSSAAELHRLNFVPEAGAKGCEIASNIYATAKGYVPASLKPRLDKVEESVSQVRTARPRAACRGASLPSPRSPVPSLLLGDRAWLASLIARR